MLEQFVQALALEIHVECKQEEIGKSKSLFLTLGNKEHFHIEQLEPGVLFKAQLIPCPQERREDFFVMCMRANLLGQGTGDGSIGLDTSEKNMTFSLAVERDLSYQEFKTSLEEFMNDCIFWRQRLLEYQTLDKGPLG